MLHPVLFVSFMCVTGDPFRVDVVLLLIIRWVRGTLGYQEVMLSASWGSRCDYFDLLSSLFLMRLTIWAMAPSPVTLQAVPKLSMAI